MPAIKIFPPKQLPDKGLSDQKFEAWTTELEVWLGKDDEMTRFMEDGQYSTWLAEKFSPGRIPDLSRLDPVTVNAEANEQAKIDKKAEIISKRKRQLKTFLSQVAKVITDNHYNVVMR